MPIRVECPGCHDVTYFADNDAGLAVACLACGRHLRVPAMTPAPVAKTVALTVSEQDRPLALPDDRPENPVPAAPKKAVAPARRPIQPARSKSRWRSYMLLVLLLGGAGTAIAVVVKHRANHATTPLAKNGLSTTQPTTIPIAVGHAATQSATAIIAAVSQPVPTARPAPVAVVAAAVVRHYTPDSAPVGFVGFDPVEITGHIEVDSYDPAVGRIGAGAAAPAAPLLRNGPNQLTP